MAWRWVRTVLTESHKLAAISAVVCKSARCRSTSSSRRLSRPVAGCAAAQTAGRPTGASVPGLGQVQRLLQRGHRAGDVRGVEPLTRLGDRRLDGEKGLERGTDGVAVAFGRSGDAACVGGGPQQRGPRGGVGKAVEQPPGRLPVAAGEVDPDRLTDHPLVDPAGRGGAVEEGEQRLLGAGLVVRVPQAAAQHAEQRLDGGGIGTGLLRASDPADGDGHLMALGADPGCGGRGSGCRPGQRQSVLAAERLVAGGQLRGAVEPSAQGLQQRECG
jgi:hypothetical protein